MIKITVYYITQLCVHKNSLAWSHTTFDTSNQHIKMLSTLTVRIKEELQTVIIFLWTEGAEMAAIHL